MNYNIKKKKVLKKLKKDKELREKISKYFHLTIPEHKTLVLKTERGYI